MKKLNKKEIQKRVLQNGKPLSLKKFSWDEKTKTFSSQEDNLVLDFFGIIDCTFKTGSRCTFDTVSGCNFKTGSRCTFKTGSYCTFDTGYRCTFDTGSDCTFDTGSGCNFKTSSGCTFKTGYRCTFKTSSYCTFKTGEKCVCVRRDIFEVIKLEEDIKYQLAPSGIKGFLKDGIYSETNKPCIIADNILSEVISKKKSGNVEVYKVKNNDSTKHSFIVKEGELYSHGETIKEAKKSLLYKISTRDTKEFKDLTLKSKLTLKECIQAYRIITGACESETRAFVEKNMEDRDYTIKELIDLTKGQYGCETFEEFFKK